MRLPANPIRPPLDTPENLAALSRAPGDHSFITGNGLASRCRYVINYDDLKVNEHVDNDWWFCRTDFIEYFFAEHEPPAPYVLFSHNSDRSVDKSFRTAMRHRRLRAWFAANADLRHPKLHAFPLGIANPHWRHGDGALVARLQLEEINKRELFDASYDISTRPEAREYCRKQTGIAPGRRHDYEEYLRSLAPRGNGLDTHRVWEALYLRTIPVVTRSVLSEQHSELPMIVLDDWADFREVDFSPELYERTMGDWRPDGLKLDSYLKRVAVILARSA
jgi:hypothetical protein